MRFMMLVKVNGDKKDYEAGLPPPPALLAAIGKLAEEAVQSGAMIDMGGLLSSAKGARVRVSRGRVTVIDGPFTEAKELIGGYAIMRAKSKDEAIEMGKQFMGVHLAAVGPDYEGELEIRQLEAPPDQES